MRRPSGKCLSCRLDLCALFAPMLSSMCFLCLVLRRIRSQIEDLFRQDRGIALVVALDTALADERYEVGEMPCWKLVPVLTASSDSCYAMHV